MNSKQSFHQWINQKSDTQHNTSEPHEQAEENIKVPQEFQPASINEHAAAEEQTHDDGLPPVYTRTYEIKESDHKKNKSNFFRLKPILWAGFSAIVVGLSLGFFILFIMGAFTDDPISQQNPTTSSDIPNNDEEAKESETTTNRSLESINAFVLQGGVFNESESAQSIEVKFQEAGYMPVIWKRNSKLYLFSGMASTKADAKDLANVDEVPEVYIKEWQTDQAEVDTDSETFEWLNTVQKNLQASIKTLSKNQNIDEKSWGSVVNTYPNEDKQFAPLYEKVKTAANAISTSSKNEQQGLLLGIWKDWEQTVVK